MTLVGLDGDAIGTPDEEPEDWQWAVEAVFTWLDDDRIYNGVVGRRLFTKKRLFIIGTMLNAAMRSGARVKEEQLKEYLRILLGDDRTRVSIARLTLERESRNRAADEIYVDEYPRLLETWEELYRTGQALAEDRPPEPTPAIPGRDRHAIMKELRDLWKRLRDEEPRRILSGGA